MTGLSARQKAILWHRAQGLTGPQIAREMCLAVATISYHERIICHTLQAANITQAVHLGHLAHLIGVRPDCGDRAAYLRHLRRHEPTCPACKAANAEHAVVQRAGTLK